MDLKNISFDWARFWMAARYILLLIVVIVARIYYDDAAFMCQNYCDAKGEKFNMYAYGNCRCETVSEIPWFKNQATNTTGYAPICTK